MHEQWQRQIKYEEELDPTFGQRTAEMAHGEQLFSCIQCGTCSGTCPVAIYMDYTPRRVIAMVRAGLKKEVLNSRTIWLCASCYSCTVECPKKVRITDVMYALKRQAIQENVHPKRFPVSVMAREFYKLVSKNGRNSEGLLIFSLYSKTNPLQFLKYSTMGLRLLLQGRMNFKKESIQAKKGSKGDLQAILKALDNVK